MSIIIIQFLFYDNVYLENSFKVYLLISKVNKLIIAFQLMCSNIYSNESEVKEKKREQQRGR